MGMSASTFTQRLNTGKFSTEELGEIAKIIGCEYVCFFRFDDGKLFTEKTIGEQIACAMAYVKMSRGELARRIGVTSPAIAKRLNTGKFSQDEIEEIAGYIGCEYVSKFLFKDGTVI